jgi:hypothetical protein
LPFSPLYAEGNSATVVPEREKKGWKYYIKETVLKLQYLTR